MTEYIKREDALAVFCDFCGVCDEDKREPLECDDILGKVLERLPAEDVRPVVRGHWLKNGYSIRCSECGYDMPFAVRNFCPNCGADMRGGGGNE